MSRRFGRKYALRAYLTVAWLAAETRHEVPDHHLQLARVYLDTGRPGLVAVEVRHVLELEAASPMERAARSEALVLRAELGGLRRIRSGARSG